MKVEGQKKVSLLGDQSWGIIEFKNPDENLCLSFQTGDALERKLFLYDRGFPLCEDAKRNRTEHGDSQPFYLGDLKIVCMR